MLKEYLTQRGIPFLERDMRSPASLTELRVNGIFVQEAPVLQNELSFLTTRDLFASGKVREDQVKRLIEGV